MGDPIGMTGLQFFGAMTASISHEIKNRMAIINEQAGLLSDFVQMARNGRPLDVERLERLAGSVKTQVSLADVIIKNMNQFAHSIDHRTGAVELGEFLGLMVELFKRRAGNSCIRLEFQPAAEPVTIETSSFLLMNLIWLCLFPLLTENTIEQKMRLVYGKNSVAGFILMDLDIPEQGKGLTLTESAENLARTLGVNLQLNPNKNELKIELPTLPLKRATA